MDYFLWNETAQYYNAYSNVDFDYQKFVNATHLKLCGTSDEAAGALADNKGGAQEEEDPAGRECVEGDPTTPGAIMTDSFYSQVGNTALTCDRDGTVNQLKLCNHLHLQILSQLSYAGKL